MGGPAAEIGADAVSEETFVVPYLGAKNPDHPLLGDVREIQRELWKVAPLGYTIGDAAPMTLVTVDTFSDAGGTIAATTDDLVSAGTLGGESEESGSVQVVASLLRPATQANLHPFGLHDYALSFLGQTVLSNALGYRQERFVDGEVVETFERGDGDVAPGEPPGAENEEGDPQKRPAFPALLDSPLVIRIDRRMSRELLAPFRRAGDQALKRGLLARVRLVENFTVDDAVVRAREKKRN
jgi:hypothetical protein